MATKRTGRRSFYYVKQRRFVHKTVDPQLCYINWFFIEIKTTTIHTNRTQLFLL